MCFCEYILAEGTLKQQNTALNREMLARIYAYERMKKYTQLRKIMVPPG